MNNIEHFVYTDTNRVKSVGFTREFLPTEIAAGVDEGFLLAREENLPNPLVQVRAIMTRSFEAELLDQIEQRNDKLPRWCHARLNARIPFSNQLQDYGIYYLTIESPGRGQFGNSIDRTQMTHQQALANAGRPIKYNILPSYTVQALNIRENSALDEWGEECRPLYNQRNIDQLIQGMINTNRNSFAHIHDENQRQYEGVRDIIENNPVMIAVPTGRPRTIAAVGILERDNRFTFNNIALVEPTYYTDPAYRREGLSLRMRLLANQLVLANTLDQYYSSSGTIIFNESIRSTSFILALRAGCALGGDWESPMINGDLGRAYTYIGPSNPNTGFMPLGLSYYHNLNSRSGGVE